MHAGIDGFSRVPVYLQCSNNNRAETVLKLFQVAVSEWGYCHVSVVTKEERIMTLRGLC